MSDLAKSLIILVPMWAAIMFVLSIICVEMLMGARVLLIENRSDRRYKQALLIAWAFLLAVTFIEALFVRRHIP
jgi:hypothetical protein